VTGATVSCPTCGSHSVQTVNVTRSSVPRELAAEYSAATGASGSDPIPQNVCARCGCRWVPRTAQARQLKALSGQLGQEAMRAAQAQAAAPPPRFAALHKVPPRAWIVAAITAAVILWALLT
jgi:predicted RNA-binding Zn-ribbon protein involved in translation (DUF1610 family)